MAVAAGPLAHPEDRGRGCVVLADAEGAPVGLLDRDLDGVAAKGIARVVAQGTLDGDGLEERKAVLAVVVRVVQFARLPVRIDPVE